LSVLVVVVTIHIITVVAVVVVVVVVHYSGLPIMLRYIVLGGARRDWSIAYGLLWVL
jgi:hypothetical protein